MMHLQKKKWLAINIVGGIAVPAQPHGTASSPSLRFYCLRCRPRSSIHLSGLYSFVEPEQHGVK